MKDRPNIVVFMTDQQLADTVGPKGLAKTPNLDKFMERAVRFTECYCPSPHCCPSRATFFTGLYPSEHGVWHNVEVDNPISRDVYDDIVMFPELLKQHGYRTIFSGKWHVSAYDGPLDRGFDTVLREFIQNYGRIERRNVPTHNDWEKVYAKLKDHGIAEKIPGRIVREGFPPFDMFGENENPHGDGDTVAAACKAIESYQGNEPFFMFVGTVGPHDSYKPPRKFLDMYKADEIRLPESFSDDMNDKPALYRRTRDQFALSADEHRECIRHYLAFCTYEDYLFGQLLDAIKAKGIYDDTIIVYLSDHGDYLGAHRLWTKGLPCFREAYNVPAVIGGGGIKASTCGSFVSLADFAPTILEYAGISGAPAKSGRSLLPLINGEAPALWRTEMFSQTNGNEAYGIQRAVWNKKWKYVLNFFDYDELYDLENDPLEMKNVINEEENKAVVREMCKKLWDFAKRSGDNCTCPYIMVTFAPYGPGMAD